MKTAKLILHGIILGGGLLLLAWGLITILS
jgi:hypothetical protein